MLLNGGLLDLRNTNSTNFGSSAALGGTAGTINVDSTPGQGAVAGQTHTSGGFSFGAAGVTRTLNITSNQVGATTIDNYGLTLGAVTMNDNAVLTSNTGGAVTLSSLTSNATGAATLSLGGSNGIAGAITISGAVNSSGGPLSLNFTNNTALVLNGALNNTTGTIAVTGRGSGSS